jgi:hypothetical protein
MVLHTEPQKPQDGKRTALIVEATQYIRTNAHSQTVTLCFGENQSYARLLVSRGIVGSVETLRR